MNVTVYTLPNCVQCDTTKRMFDSNGVEYNTVDLSTDSAALEKVREMGYQSAPVIITDHDNWSGFKMDKIKEAITEYKSDKIKKVS